MSPTSTVEKSMVSAVVETLEKLYGEPLKQLDSLIKATGLPVYRDPRSGALLWVDVREMRLRFTLSVNKLEKFVEGMQRGRLMYMQCKRCSGKCFPPRVDCSRCKTSDVEWRETSTEGELITWTVINVKPASFSHHNDYVVGIVKMPDGFNVTAWIDADPKALKPGMKVRLVVNRRPGENYITYWFKPANFYTSPFLGPMDEEYLTLLERAYKLVAPKAQRRAEIPRIEVENMPRKTVIPNFGQIAKRLNRDIYFMAKFFQKELAVPGTVEGDVFTLHGEKSPKVVEAVYERFIRYYVVCPVCNSIDTELNREGRIFVMRCLACGASTPVKPL